MSRHDFGSVLIVFPILKQLLALKPEFERTVEHCDINVKSKFTSILTTLHTTVSKKIIFKKENKHSLATNNNNNIY